MQKLIKISATFCTLLVLATSCSTLPEDPRTWETIDYKKQNQVPNRNPRPSKFYNDFDEGNGSSTGTGSGTGGSTNTGTTTHGN